MENFHTQALREKCPYSEFLYFPSFGQNTQRYSVSLCIQSECWKIRTKKTPNMNTFCIVKFAIENGIGLCPSDPLIQLSY